MSRREGEFLGSDMLGCFGWVVFVRGVGGGRSRRSVFFKGWGGAD